MALSTANQSSLACLPWVECDHGHVGGDGIAIRKCSTEYLSALIQSFESMMSGSTDIGMPGPLAEELYRLQLYPTLYPTSEVRSRFHKLLVSGFRKFLLEKYQIIDDSNLEDENYITEKMRSLIEHLNLKTYKRELQPWEQFLLKGSPGSGAKLPDTPSHQIARLMPIGGVSLHLRWLKNRYVAGNKCREATLPEGKILRCAAASALKPPTRPAALPSSGLRNTQSWTRLTPNPYFEYHLLALGNSDAVEKLEKLSDTIDYLEGEANANPPVPTSALAMVYKSTNVTLQIDDKEFDE